MTSNTPVAGTGYCGRPDDWRIFEEWRPVSTASTKAIEGNIYVPQRNLSGQ